MNNSIKELQLIIKNNLYHSNNLLFKRKNKITFTDMFFYMTNLIKNKKSSSTTVSTEFICNKLCFATADAYVKKRKNIPSIFFQMLSYDLLDYHYSINNRLLFNKYRILAVDGTHSPLSKKLMNDNFKLTKNQTYVNSLISGIYDISNRTIIDLKISQSNSERKTYYKQLDELQKNDIVIHDRGYYSHKLLYKLYSKNIYPIFRMRQNLKIVKKFINSDLDDAIFIINNYHTNSTPIKLRLIKYIIKNKTYVLSTTILDKLFTVNTFRDLYKDRWKIETYFRTIKYDLSFSNFHSKQLELIKQEIYAHNILTQLTRILEELYMKNNRQMKNKLKQYNTNFKNNLNNTNNILKILLYNTDIRPIIRVMHILFKYLVKIRPNRTFPRRAIIPASKWYYCGLTGIT